MIDRMRLECLLCQVCDGRSDCSNARDEDDCDTGDTCPEYLFSCDNGQCISQVIQADLLIMIHDFRKGIKVNDQYCSGECL